MTRNRFAFVFALFMAGASGFSAAQTANWSGPYLGGNVGYGWGKSRVTTDTVFSPTGYFATTSVPAISAAGSGTIKPSGVTGGLTGGFNRQVDAMVYGVEADLNAFHASASRSSTATYPCCPPTTFTVTENTKAENLFTLRGRIGFAQNRSLFYATGGIAATRLKANDFFNDTFATAAESGSIAKTKTGWVIGGGYEFNLQNRWSMKVEYLHMAFGGVSGAGGTFTAFTPAIAFPTSTFSHSANLRMEMLRLGANYRF